MNLAAALISGVQIWLVTGLVVAVVFLVWGIDRIDEDARGAYAFRPLIVPGVVLIWPLVLWRWVVLESGRDQWMRRYTPVRSKHFWAALLLASLVIAILVTGLLIRQQWPTDYQPQKITMQTGWLA